MQIILMVRHNSETRVHYTRNQGDFGYYISTPTDVFRSYPFKGERDYTD